MAEERRLQHCCKGRHCCRDGSCRTVYEEGNVPEEYDDAPQWQKDAWDADTEIDKTFQRGGWVTPSETVYGFPAANFTPEFPQVTVKRDGIRFPHFAWSYSIQEIGRWGRKKYVLWMDNKGFTFSTRRDAERARDALTDRMEAVNTAYDKEKEQHVGEAAG